MASTERGMFCFILLLTGLCIAWSATVSHKSDKVTQERVHSCESEEHVKLCRDAFFGNALKGACEKDTGVGRETYEQLWTGEKQSSCIVSLYASCETPRVHACMNLLATSGEGMVPICGANELHYGDNCTNWYGASIGMFITMCAFMAFFMSS